MFSFQKETTHILKQIDIKKSIYCRLFIGNEDLFAIIIYTILKNASVYFERWKIRIESLTYTFLLGEKEGRRMRERGHYI